MNIIIAFDIASEVSTFCIMHKNGQITEEDAIETKIRELKRIIKKVPKPRQVVFVTNNVKARIGVVL